MEINHLRLIRALVVDPNLSRAAERLHLTQSGLSKRVSAMEEELGCALFERRGPRGLKPLPAALELAKIADRLITAWDAGVKRVQRVSDEPEHFVLVGPQLFLRDIVFPWWQKASNDFPELTLEVQVSTLSRISLELIQAGADAGILEHQEELSDYVCKPLYSERWGIVRHPTPRGKPKPPLEELRWGTYSPRDNPVDTWLVKRQRMSPPTYRFYWSDLTAIARWVAETPKSASVLPWHVVENWSREGRVEFEEIGTGDREGSTQLYLAYPKDPPHPRFIKALMALAKG